MSAEPGWSATRQLTLLVIDQVSSGADSSWNEPPSDRATGRRGRLSGSAARRALSLGGALLIGLSAGTQTTETISKLSRSAAADGPLTATDGRQRLPAGEHAAPAS